ncbi:hypothetical protein [Lacinutrix sp. Bg11-31]|uniref:hypothetical protein n=1 Tax=Lacinutrix sp. Bg11-31 TaxID=2057808 RepID=UPI000C313052|nr:hypothetical protein [Lacinutrix sp. Bg11-31]AUC81802.1 hypothetical protein CW733_06525 [Lacinutrix sp. Bg11-31]
MEINSNNKPKLNNQFFDNFSLEDSIANLIDTCNYNLNERYLSHDVKEIIIFCLNELKKIKCFIKNEIRFDYLTIQKEMDRLYKEDSSITGYHIVFDFIEKENPNRAKFNVLKSKTN